LPLPSFLMIRGPLDHGSASMRSICDLLNECGLKHPTKDRGSRATAESDADVRPPEQVTMSVRVSSRTGLQRLFDAALAVSNLAIH
jgi:hypothetical protein